MKVSSLVTVISNFERVVAAVGGSEKSSDLNHLRELFVGHEEASVGPFINALIKRQASHEQDSSSPPIARLARILTELEALLRSADGKKAAEDVSKLVKLLEGSEHASVTQFVNEARRSLIEPAKARVRSVKATSKKPPVLVPK
jgi:UDP-N-acetylmuramoylalanine-D-glutamate ligase